MKMKPKIKQVPPSTSDRVLDATSLIFAQGNKRTASEVTEAVKCAYQKTVAAFESLTVNEMAMVLLMHIVVLGRRLNAETGND
jgi:hypothetical protein